MDKRATLTTRQIVILTVLIISFIIILFLIFRLNLGGETKKEVCRNSVLLAGKSLFPSLVSLDCHEEYICLSKTNKCDKTADEIIQVKTPEDVYKAIADRMADCWWMFGEGNIDYVSRAVLSTGYYCSICSNIVFDKSIKEIFKDREGFLYKKENLKEKIFTIKQEFLENERSSFTIYDVPNIYLQFKDGMWHWSIDSFNWKEEFDYNSFLVEYQLSKPEAQRLHYQPLTLTSIQILKSLNDVKTDEGAGLEIIFGDACYGPSTTCFSQRDLYGYITHREIPGKGIQYDEYLYGIDFTDADQYLKLSSNEEIKTDKFQNVNLDKNHVILMAIRDQISSWTWPIIAGVVTAGAVIAVVVTGGAGLPVIAAIVKALHVGTIVVVGAGVGGFIGGATFTAIVADGPSGNSYIKPCMLELNSRSFEKYACYDIITFS